MSRIEDETKLWILRWIRWGLYMKEDDVWPYDQAEAEFWYRMRPHLKRGNGRVDDE